MSEWKEYLLSDVADVTSSKRIFYSDYVEAGVPFWRSKEIIEKFNRKPVTTELFIPEDKYEEIRTKYGVPNPGDILLTSVGTLGIPYLVKPGDRFYFKDGNLTWIRKIDKERLLPEYLYLWLCSNIGQSALSEIAIGSTQEALTIVGLKGLILLLPPLPEQKAIAEVLSSLDDKIDLLHRQNKTLEEMAMTLFRKWFIEPTKDGLPEGWEEKKLKDVYIFEKGIEPGSKNYLETPSVDTIRFIRVGDMLDNKANVYIQKYLVGNSICKFDDLLVSFDGTVGRVSFGIEGCYSSGIRKIYSEDEIYNKLWLKHQIFISEEIQDEINMYAEGTTILHSSSSIDYLSFVLPPKEKIEEYDKFFDPIYKKILHNKTQIQTLEKLRDTLLPKLISGELRVKV
jgi:type I restriction enzyme S subunit